MRGSIAGKNGLPIGVRGRPGRVSCLRARSHPLPPAGLIIAAKQLAGSVVNRDLKQIARHWRALGADDPLWAVYVAPGTRHGGWDIDAFFETGRAEVARVLDDPALAEIPSGRAVALDFGCGVGRLSQALASRFDRVIAVDVSEPMLDRARELDRSQGRIDWVRNERPDLAFVDDASVDLIYSSLVLQHLPRPLAAGYLAEFVRILRSGGAAVIQVASRPTPSVKGWAFRLLPAPVTGFVQRKLLRYPAPMRMQAMPRAWVSDIVGNAGGRIRSASDDPSYGGHWVYTRFVIERVD
jgi:SAM-dependent methyltransferase